MACWVDDCDGCGCAALAGRGGMPPCGHCEGHGIDLEPFAMRAYLALEAAAYRSRALSMVR